ncbi:flagellar basal body rod protein FlgC [Bacillaceae bacterium JMAK1]|nr:flagellar basal body rod protein FlgC [Bacillaceae bacterium JMAK1]
MIRGFYNAASGMITQQRRTDVLNDNLANVTTPGYKADHASVRAFPNMLIQAMNTNSRQPIGELNTGVYMQERTADFRQGDLRETNVGTDIALLQGIVGEGSLLFVVSDDDGEPVYTRNGNFTVDGNGYLTTSNGNRVLGTDGEPLLVTNEWFSVNDMGTVVDHVGEEVGQINIAYAEDHHDLVKAGEGLLRYNDGELPSAVEDDALTYVLQQGFLEQSNVDPLQTMTELMSAHRLYEANQTILQAYDQNMQRAANDIGKLG